MLIDNYYFTKNEQFDQSIWRNQKPQIGQIITENDICFYSHKDKVFFNTLTTEEKRRFLCDYRDFPSIIGFDIFAINLREGILRTYPADITIKYVKKVLNIPDSMIKKINSNGEELIAVVILNVGNNLDSIIRIMNLCGYYLGTPKIETIKPNQVVQLQFEPRVSNNCIKATDLDLIYHWTRPELVKKILKNGLVPRAKNNLYSYPERIYFIKSNISVNDLFNIGGMLASALNYDKYANNIAFNQNLALLSIDTKKLNKDFKFFPDPNYAEYGIYCLDNIPPYVILNEQIINKEFSFIPKNE